jgi:hypothetical protein
VSGRIVDKATEEARWKRLGLKLNDSDINRQTLAMKVLLLDDDEYSEKLERHERLFIVRLLDPKLAAAITKSKKERGRPVTNATALLADQIAESYFTRQAMWPHQKHKQLAPDVASFYGVSRSYVDKVLWKLDPTRRAEMITHAALVAEKYKAWLASPKGIASMAEYEALKRAQQAKRSGAHVSSKRS